MSVLLTSYYVCC